MRELRRVFVLALVVRSCATFLSVPRGPQAHQSRAPACQCCADKGGGDEPSFGDRLQTLLDTPVINTTESSDDERDWLRGFKALLASDYELAETLYVGVYFAILIFFAQQGVRIYKHCYFMPDKLCPWEVTPSLDTLLNQM